MISLLLVLNLHAACFLTFDINHPASAEGQIDYVLDTIKEENQTLPGYQWHAQPSDMEMLLCDAEITDC